MSTTTPGSVFQDPQLAFSRVLPAMLRQKLIAEGIGTFLFIITIAVCITPPVPVLAPIAIGMMLTCMIYCFGYISGGHFNPAVTLAVLTAGKIPLKDALLYMLVQTCCGAGAGFMAVLVHQNLSTQMGAPDNQVSTFGGAVQVFLAESIFSFCLTTVVLHVAVSPQKDNSFYGTAIGGIIVVGATVMGEFSGGSFNPAVSLGLPFVRCIVGHNCRMLSWSPLYIVAELSSGAIAGLIFRYLQLPTLLVVEEHNSLEMSEANVGAPINTASSHMRPIAA